MVALLSPQDESAHHLLRERRDSLEELADIDEKRSRSPRVTERIRSLIPMRIRPNRLPPLPLSILLLFCIALLYRYTSPHVLSRAPVGSQVDPDEHPIERLFRDRTAEYEVKLERQSKTAKDAAKEYMRRYGRRPPPGFGEWFAFAQERDFQFVDEWDTVMRAFEPYWGVHPETLRQRFQTGLGFVSFHHIIGNESGVYGSGGLYSPTVENWMRNLPWQKMMPRVEFAYNSWDEPRVSIANEVKEHALKLASTQRPSSKGNSPVLEPAETEISEKNFPRESIVEYIIDGCGPTESARRSNVSHNWDDVDYPSFIENRTHQLQKGDHCLDPQLHKHYSVFRSPVTMYLTKHLVPLFSQSRPPRFNDLLFPSPWYWEDMDGQKHPPVPDEIDIPFAQRQKRVYWVGTFQEGYNTLANFRDLNRHHMVLKTAPDDRPVALLHRAETDEGTTPWLPRVGATWRDLRSRFHVHPSKAVFCTDSCALENEMFNFTAEPMEASYGSQYCLDIDGTGYSGRYYRLLKSNCAVLKQTIFEEWHDDRLLPWVHYVPVSPDANELGEVGRFLVEEEAGQEIGRRIAEEGREWSRKVLRKEDLEVAFLRVLLEYMRVVDPERDTMFFDG